MRSLLGAVLVSLSIVLPASAQETRGTILGTVQDATGVLPGASVKITNVDTKTSQQLVTNTQGYFEAPLLQAGTYEVSVEMPGFKTSTRSGLLLAVGQQLPVTFTLEVGQITEKVTVTAETPVIDTTSVSSGANFDKQLVDSLPMFSNMPIMLVRYAPGVNPNAEQNQVSQGFIDGPNNAAGSAIGGSPTGVGNNTYTIDGATNAGSGRRLASSPNSDMIQEMRVETSNFDASSGHGLGNQISMMTRAGTNSLRGTANYQYWTNQLNALNEQQKETFTADAKRIYEMGNSKNIAFTLGGPVYIPKVYDGRGKMFFFGNFSPVRDDIPGHNLGTSTVPANAKHLQGDFSDMLRLPSPNQYIIYDPLTARQDPNTTSARIIRTAFPNNVIPRDRIFNPDGSYKNPFMNLYSAMVPVPNQNFVENGQQPSGNYYRGAEPDIISSYVFGGRVDYNVNESNRFFFRGSGQTFDEDFADWTYESPDPSLKNIHNANRQRHNWSYTGTWTHSVGATVFDTQLSTNQFYQQDKYFRLHEYKPSMFGLPTYMDDFCAGESGGCAMPRINIDGYQAMSNGNNDGDTTTNLQGQFNMTQVRGSHTLRGGVDVRRAERLRTGGGNNSGAFNFTRDYTRAASDESGQTASNLGLALAAALLGTPTSIQITEQPGALYSNHFFGAFAQDTWRIGRNLTLNAGLRFEYEDGISEKEDRMVVGFDPDAITSITAIAESSYAANPITTQPAPATISVRGGSLFATSPGQDGSTWGGQAMWMPRVSAAYKLNERTVVKGGYGIYYDTLNAGDYGASQAGYDSTTTTASSNDLGRTLRLQMNTGAYEPFPLRADGTRFDAPVGDTLGIDTVLGQGFSPENLNREHSRQQRWRVSVQRELLRNLGLEVAYSGSYSDHLNVSIRQDYLPEEYWNGSNERNTAANTILTQSVANPYLLSKFTSLQTTNPTLYNRMAANTFFTNATIQRQRVLRNFSHINNLTYNNLPLGEQKVHSLEITVNRRFANGLSGVSSLTFNSVRANRTVEEYDREPTLWQSTNGGRPYRFTASAVYELPFGEGRHFLNEGGVIPAVVGGWSFAGTYDYQPGSLLDWGNNNPAGGIFFYGDLEDIPVDNPTMDRWFNTDAGFEKDTARTPASFQKRTFPFRLDDVRGQAVSVFSVSLSRSIDIGSNRTVQLRIDSQNVLNRQQWQNANTNPTSTNFGRVTDVTSAFMRFISFGVKLNF